MVLNQYSFQYYPHPHHLSNTTNVHRLSTALLDPPKAVSFRTDAFIAAELFVSDDSAPCNLWMWCFHVMSYSICSVPLYRPIHRHHSRARVFWVNAFICSTYNLFRHHLLRPLLRAGSTSHHRLLPIIRSRVIAFFWSRHIFIGSIIFYYLDGFG